MYFINRADQCHPRILWCILVRSTSLITNFESVCLALFMLMSVVYLVLIVTTINIACPYRLTNAGKRKANFDASTRTSYSKQKLLARWNFFTQHILCLRRVLFTRDWVIVRCVNTYNATKQNLFYVWLQVIKTDFTVQNWSETNSHYTVVVEAAIDNKSHEDDLPLAPWYWHFSWDILRRHSSHNTVKHYTLFDTVWLIYYRSKIIIHIHVTRIRDRQPHVI